MFKPLACLELSGLARILECGLVDDSTCFGCSSLEPYLSGSKHVGWLKTRATKAVRIIDHELGSLSRDSVCVSNGSRAQGLEGLEWLEWLE